jgi:Fic family protein
MHNHTAQEWQLDMLTADSFVVDTRQFDLAQTYFWLGVLKGKIDMLSHPELLLMPLVVIESVKSSNIESIASTVLDQLQIHLKGRKTVSAEQKLTEHYKDALLAGFEYIVRTKKFDLELILLIQRTILPESTGIRDTEPIVIANTISGEVLWSPPLGKQKILAYLENWCQWATIHPEVEPLVAVGLLHSQFEAIHPFLDGNGRAGRILIILYLVYKKILDYPCLFLSDAILKTRTYYYLALQESQKRKNHVEIIRYILHAIGDKAQHSCHVIDSILALKEWFDTQVQRVLPDMYSATLIEYLVNHPFYTITNLCRELKISRNTGSRYLSLLVERGILQIQPTRKNKLFYNQAFLTLLSS